MRAGLMSTVAGLALLTAPAAAQQFDWSGFYAGVHGGFFSGEVVVTEEYEMARLGTLSGPIGGLLAGYNFTHDALVLGLEADFGIANASGDTQDDDPCGGQQLDCNLDLYDYGYELHWNAHLRGRLGMPLGDDGNIMPFVAAGLALANYDVTEEAVLLGSGVTAGFTLGAGIDVGFSDTVVGRVEILYDDYGTRTEDYYSSTLTGWTGRAALMVMLDP